MYFLTLTLCIFYSCNFLNNILFPLAHFTVRILYVIHITYKISVNSSSVRLLVNSWLLVVKFLRESKVICWVLPGGSEVKNPLANPGNMGSIPDQGGSHVPQSNQAHEQQLSVYFRACSPNYWDQVSSAWAWQQKQPPQWEAYRLQLESGPLSLQLEKSPCSKEDPAQPKINK